MRSIKALSLLLGAYRTNKHMHCLLDCKLHNRPSVPFLRKSALVMSSLLKFERLLLVYCYKDYGNSIYSFSTPKQQLAKFVFIYNSKLRKNALHKRFFVFFIRLYHSVDFLRAFLFFLRGTWPALGTVYVRALLT